MVDIKRHVLKLGNSMVTLNNILATPKPNQADPKQKNTKNHGCIQISGPLVKCVFSNNMYSSWEVQAKQKPNTQLKPWFGNFFWPK